MFDNEFASNYDHCKTYKTVETLKTALIKMGLDEDARRALLIKVPHGKNVDRFTAVFPWMNGKNNHIIFCGFKVMG